MTSKERATLRAKANSLEALFQVGKGGVSGALIEQVKSVFETRELIKLKVLLETSPGEPKEIAAAIAEAAEAEIVQVIGGAMVFYKYNPELHENGSADKKDAVTESVKPKKKAAPVKKKGTANRPNSKKRRKTELPRAEGAERQRTRKIIKNVTKNFK